MARLSLRGWRCWWQPPFGHVDELIDYVDALSGRWTARIRCARCGREAALSVGEHGHHSVHPKNPLTLMLPRQGGRSLPARRRVTLTPSADGRGALTLELPDGRLVHVRAVEARLSLGRRKVMYLAGTSGARPFVSPELRGALSQACAGTDDAWLEGTARQLEAELLVGS